MRERDEIEQVIEQLEAEARRWETVREGLSTTDPQAWWLLTAGDLFQDAADRLRKGLLRCERVYGGDVRQRVSALLRRRSGETEGCNTDSKRR